MRINHNIQALNAYRNLSQNQGTVSKHLEKLSSGLRINRAADDAAGLAISEKMRSQIRGLAMAERNTMDGISLIQTGEGALGTSHEILQRMRELAVQSANGTLADQDREAVQNEIDQLTQELDRISRTTQFNGKNLLSGSADGKSFASTGSKDLKYIGSGTWDGKLTADPSSKAAVQVNLDINLGKLDDTATDGTIFTINGINYELDVTGDGVGPGSVAVPITGWKNQAPPPAALNEADAKDNVNNVLDALKKAITAKDPTFDTNESVVTPATETGAAAGFDTDGVLLLKTSKYMSPKDASQISVSTTAAAGVVFSEEGNPATTTTKLIGKTDASGSKSVSLNFDDVPKAGDKLKIDNMTIKFGTPAAAYNAGTNEITIDPTNKTVADILKEVNQALADVAATDADALPNLSEARVSGNGLELSTNKTDDGSTNGLVIQITDADFESKAGQELILQMQIGANAQESMNINIGVMDAASLGLARGADHKTIIDTPGVDALAGIDVSSSQEAANKAISIIDAAVKKVSEERSKLGAYQNRMEHTVTNLTTANENLTAAESRIRDADMAMEMTNFTKNNIINQSATAMLAQANQLPQGILQLLK
ncbi:flagellin [uncultured Brevibacillus sp.]|uniref:flagellin N-terminal helical domain-containing protein n=1 Tax=uncultured Brevibacillus sp. TaxID=169970 RepID=UPI002596C3B2|nr:flagellin [uncultured Brevibacillus sp.]